MPRKLTPPPKPTDRPKSLRELAAKLAIPYERVLRLRKDGLQTRADGTFDVNEAKAFLKARTARTSGVHATPEAKEWSERRLKAIALRLEKELADHQARFISKKQVIKEWTRNAKHINDAFASLGSDLAPKLVGKSPQEIQAIMDADIMARLRALAQTR
jgi:hypothetical protein